MLTMCQTQCTGEVNKTQSLHRKLILWHFTYCVTLKKLLNLSDSPAHHLYQEMAGMLDF